jgi:Cytochrome c
MCASGASTGELPRGDPRVDASCYEFSRPKHVSWLSNHRSEGNLPRMQYPTGRSSWRAALLPWCCGLSGCVAAAYPLEHYEAAYTKAALETPAPDPAELAQLSQTEVDRVVRGRYLVQITGCAACHTDGALIGEPNAARQLAGSHLGIAYTSPFQSSFPGVVYPPNLTPDPKTGLGNWTDAQIITAIRNGNSSAPQGHLLVMSWPLYQQMTDNDVEAIVTYLRNIPAIEHEVPKHVAPGTRASTSYVYFNVYRSGPELQIH